MFNTEPPEHPLSDFVAQLTSVCGDPAIRRLARRRAGDPELAQDALQEAFYSVARTKNPAGIMDLRAYFCKVLIHEINRQRHQLCAVPVEDTETLTTTPHTATVGTGPDRPIDVEVAWRQVLDGWLASFGSGLGRLVQTIPGRSGDPARYRAVIAQTAERILRAAGDGQVTQDDSNTALRAAYPQWFGEPGCPEDTCYKRLSRARSDIQALLKTIVNREDLSPG